MTLNNKDMYERYIKYPVFKAYNRTLFIDVITQQGEQI